MLGLLERSKGTRAEPFVFRLQLVEDIESRAFAGLLLHEPILLLSSAVQLPLNLEQTHPALLDGAALVLRVELLRLNACGKLAQPRFKPCAFFFELDFFGR